MRIQYFMTVLALLLVPGVVELRAASLIVDAIAVTGVDDARGPGLGAGVSYNNFSDLQFGPAGLVAFRGTLTGGTTSGGIFSGVGSGVSAAVLQGDAAPGVADTTFAFVSPRGFRSNGDLLYVSELSGPSITPANDGASYMVGGSAPLIRDTDAAPGLLGATIITQIPSVAGDRNTFLTQVQGLGVSASNDFVVFSGPSLTQVVREGFGGANTDLAPNEYFGSTPSLFSSRGNNVLFSEEVFQSPTNTNLGGGIFAWNGTDISTIARRNGPVSSIPGTQYSDNFIPRDVNPAGDIAIKTLISGSGVITSNNRALFRASASDFDMSLIARTGDPVPGVPGQVFNEVAPFNNSARLGGDGMAAYIGQYATSTQRGLFLQRGGENLAIALGGDSSLPGLLSGESFNSPSTSSAFMVSENGAVVFQNFIANSGSRRGLWYYGLNNEVHYLMRTGDLFDVDPSTGVETRTISSFDILANSSFIDDRNFYVSMTFSDASKGLFQFSVVPEPASLALLLLGTLTLSGRQARRAR
jgi:hypothetical protein